MTCNYAMLTSIRFGSIKTICFRPIKMCFFFLENLKLQLPIAFVTTTLESLRYIRAKKINEVYQNFEK